MNTHSTIREQVSATLRRTPLLSPSASRVLAALGDEEHSIQNIARIIETDSVLTAHTLRVVNSAAYSLARKIDSLERAITYLGKNVIVGIVIGYTTTAIYDKPLEGYLSERGEYWAHSLRTAIASGGIAKYATAEVDSGLAYTAGLLHDMGKSILSRFMKDSTESLLACLETGDAGDFLEAERLTLGTDHCEVGGDLAEMWKLPETLHQAIRFHHHPSEADPAHRPLTYVVHLGDTVAMMAGSGTGMDCMNYPLDPGYAEHLDISQEALPELMLYTEGEFNKMNSALFGNDGGRN